MSIPHSQGATADLAALGLLPNYSALPELVRERAKNTLLDWVSVLLAGWSEASIQPLLDQARAEGGAPRASLLGLGERLGAEAAARVNGAVSHVLDFDDAHLASRVHPSVVLWPAIMAAGEVNARSGTEALAALVAGVETQAQVAAWLGQEHYRQGWHSTATLGSFGATAAAGRLYALSQLQLQHALGIAASLTGGLRAVFGTPTKPLQVGRAAANGVLAADLAQRGFEAIPDVFEHPQGYLATLGAPIPQAAPVLDADYQASAQIVFKYHASCYGTQAPIEAALLLAQRLAAEQKTLDQLGPLQLAVEPQYLDVCNLLNPQTALQARFSLGHCVALALAGWSTVEKASFAPSALTHPPLVALRQRIQVVADPKLPRAQARLAAPNLGADWVFQADASRPESDWAAQRERLKAKSAQLLDPLLTPSGLHELHALILAFEHFDDLNHWTQSLNQLVRAARRP